MSKQYDWHRVLDKGALAPGRVMVVTAGHQSLALTHHDGKISALDNACPHQGGPLGEGSIENGWLRCPWHGWDFHPCTGKPPGGYDDGVATFPVEERDDGIWVGVPQEGGHEATISDRMVETMLAWGVRNVFGMVGHSNLGLADAMRIQEQNGKLRYIGIRHEGAASFAVSAYGKLTGKIAACFSIAGPGATNLLTGLWDANVDRAPALALTGQVNTQVLGPGAFQEVDLQAAFGKVATFSQTVLRDSRHVELVNLACKHALLERGVSHLIFPDEVQTLPAGSGEAGSPTGRVADGDIAPPASSLAQACELLARSRRPAIIVGHGARFAMDDVLALAEKLRAPVLTTFKGKGLIADDHELGCGVLGRSGTPIASWFMNDSDCLLVFGASFSNHTGITPKKPTIQVDSDALALGRFHGIDVPVQGEIGVTARDLRKRLGDAVDANEDRRDEIAERWRIWRQEKERRRQDDRGHGLNSATVFETLSHTVDDRAILCVDVGNNTYSFGRYFECKQQAVLMSGYLGSIGFSLPAALGAWAATQEDDPRFAGRQVVSVSGDGGFGQYMAEFTTAVHYGMNLTHVLLHNDELGKISKEQLAGQWDVWQTRLVNPNFADYATSCGGLGIRVDNPEQLESALRQALDHDGPALVEIMCDAKLI